VEGASTTPESWDVVLTDTEGMHPLVSAAPRVVPAWLSVVYGSRTTVARAFAHTFSRTASSQVTPVQNCVEAHEFPHEPQF
jgi:hypothetical protein